MSPQNQLIIWQTCVELAKLITMVLNICRDMLSSDFCEAQLHFIFYFWYILGLSLGWLQEVEAFF
jgi:hypothetical protein